MTDDRLHAYLDGELDRVAHERLVRDLAADPDLARRLEELRALDDALGASLPAVEAGDDFTARLLERVRRAKRRGRIVRLAALAASAAALLLAAVLLLSGGSSPPPELFSQEDYLDYVWEADAATYGSLAIDDLESQILRELEAS